VTLSAGRKLWVRVWARSTNPFAMQLRWQNSTGGLMPGSSLQTAPLTPDYQLFPILPSTTTVAGRYRPVLMMGHAPRGTVVAVDEIQVFMV